MDPSEHIKSELESFREQWRAEVRARNPSAQSDEATTSSASTSKAPRASGLSRKPPQAVNPIAQDDDEDYIQAGSFDESTAETSSSLRSSSRPECGTSGKGKEPESALDHYERAVEKEAQGSLGDSLRLYRKAFRMDSGVDQMYKAKHFPTPISQKPVHADPSNGPGTLTNLARHPQEGQPLSIKDLITSFAGFAIEPTPPEIEGMPQPPCPVAKLPGEILVHILQDVAILDIGDFVRLSQVCRRLAYLVSTEDRIWRRICLGSEFGFGGMHYDWQLGVLWGLLDEEATLEDGTLSGDEMLRRREEEKLAATNVFLNCLYSASWQRMFRLRPRIRFNGCYICTVNYIRAGQASAHQITWNSPVHIVTYYRYLRFFRDGSVISLLTTAEPADVVHHLTKELLDLHRDGAMTHLPSAVMQSGLKGRWRLSSSSDSPEKSLSEVEGDLFVETEGVGKYIYRLELSLRSAGKGARNNKLAWSGFYSYNRLTDDWGEFGMKNYKPFFFSRVRSYGVGE